MCMIMHYILESLANEESFVETIKGDKRTSTKENIVLVYAQG